MTESLQLDDITRRFADSERTLAKARAQVEELVTAQQTASASSATLQEVAASVRGFADTAEKVVGQLQEVQRDAREVLIAGVHLLDGSDLKDLRTSVDLLAETVIARIEALEARVADVEKLRAERDEAEESRHLLERQLTHIRTTVSSRALRKADDTMPGA